MKKKVLLYLLPALLSACGPEGSSDAREFDEGSSEARISYQGRTTSTLSDAVCAPAALPSLDAVQLVPTDLVTWPWATNKRFVDEGVGSAYVIIVDVPGDPTKFVAYGFDVRDQKMLFHVQGPKVRILEAFTFQLQRDFLALHEPVVVPGFATRSSSAPTGVVMLPPGAEVPPIPPETPGINEPNLRIILGFYQLTVRLDFFSVKENVQLGEKSPGLQ
jgi:hypothetical protein